MIKLNIPLPSYKRSIGRGAEWSLNHPWTVLALVGVSLGLAGLGASHLSVDPSPEAYLKDTAEWATYTQIDRTYGIGEIVVIALHEPGGTVFDTETVSAVAELDRVIRQLPSVKRVLSITSAPTLIGPADIGRGSEDLGFRPILPPGPIEADSARELARRISHHPLYRRLLVDPPHETTFVMVQLDSATTDPVRRLGSLREIRARADLFQSKARSVHLAGSTVVKEAIASGVQHDMLLFFPAAIALLAVLLWIMYGELIASLVPIAVVGYASLLVIGLLGALGIQLNMANTTVPTMILVVGLSDSIHYLSELRRQYARTGERRAALIATTESVAMPCLLTALTSAVGFAALVASRVGPLREFGWASALGLMIPYFSSMFLAPVLLEAFKYPRTRTRAFVASPRLAAALTRFAGMAGRRILIPVCAVGLLTGASIATMAHLRVNSDFVDYLNQDHRLRLDLAMIERTLGGADAIEIIVAGNEANAFLDPAHVVAVDQIAQDLRKIDGIAGVFGYPDLLRLSYGGVQGIAESETGPLPGSSAAVSQLLLIGSDAFGAYSSADLKQVRLTVGVSTLSSEAILALAERIRTTAETRLRGTGMTVAVTGLPPMFATVVRFLVEDATGSFGLAALVIWLTMVFGFRSFSLGTLAMIPNVLPVGLTFATMVAMGYSFDTNSAFVACLGIGIDVDDTIHIITRYQKAREQGSPTPKTALHYAFTHAGHPVIMTSVLLIVGFSVLGLSSFTPTVRVGLLSALLVAYAVLFDLFLLPVLLIALDRLGHHFEPKERTRPSSLSGSFHSIAHVLTAPLPDDSGSASPEPPRPESDVTPRRALPPT